MLAYIGVAFIGIIISVLGIVNMTGNISSLHWYHRQRVTEEDRRPFGRLVGIGTLIIGVAMMLCAVLFAVADMAALTWLTAVSAGVVIAGAAVGIVISFYAMIKYNKGIF